jgi:F-box/leucine-rich repeat protein 2/20
VFDCGNVTWAGVREILSNNTFVPGLSNNKFVPRFSNLNMPQALDQSDLTLSAFSLGLEDWQETPYTAPPSTIATNPDTYPNEIIQLKCFYGWQMTVDEHTKRVLRGNLAAATRLERKWADYMIATEEAGVAGAGARRRRRRAREAELMFAEDDDDDNWYGPGGLAPLGGRRRRARSGGCVVM